MNVAKADKFMNSLALDAYRVGGSVRDELIHRKAKDADYVVFGQSLEALAAHINLAGVKTFPLKPRGKTTIGFHVPIPNVGTVEVALPRTEMSTGPLHSDFEIRVDPFLKPHEDAKRRDFTINALYFRLADQTIIDPLSGRADLKDKLISTTHPDSFRDDSLRILRAARFSSKLDFEVSEETFKQMQLHASAVTGLTDKGVSGTAVTELEGILMSKHPAKGLRLLRDSGALAEFLPELAPMIGHLGNSRYHDKTIDEHTFDAIQAAADSGANLRVRLALLFHDCGKPDVEWLGSDGKHHYYAIPKKELELHEKFNVPVPKDADKDHEDISAEKFSAAAHRLNLPKKLRRDVITLVGRHMLTLSGRTKEAKVRRWRAELGDELFHDLIRHRTADVIGKGEVDNLSAYTEQLEALMRLEDIRRRAEKAGIPTKASELSISGNDLRELGIEGPAIGKVLGTLLHEVLSQPKLDTPEWLLERAAKLAGTQKGTE